MTQEKLLIVDDDAELCELLTDYMSNEGYLVSSCGSAEAARSALEAESYDLMILDIQMPGDSGLDLLQSLRPRIKIPVIMLTGRGDEIDRILGLEMGADDYLGKPCNPRELLARIRAVMRRAQQAQDNGNGELFPQQSLELADVYLDPGVREVKVKGEPVELTSAEFNVLAYLMQQAGQVMSKDQLTELVLHRKLTAYDRALDVHVSRVRQKLARILGEERELIKTVRGEGYLFIKHNPTADL